MSKILLAAVAAFSMVAVAPAFAAGGFEAEPQSKALSTVNVDFHNPAEAQSFYVKLTRTAAEVCDSHSANPIVLQEDRVCAAKATANAVAKLAQPTVTALYNNPRDKGVNQLAAR